MFQVANVKFSEMKNKDIVDRSGETIGRIIDFHFRYKDGKVQLQSIVMGGGRVEEFLESIGLRKDIDPFFSLDLIDRYEDDKLYLKVDYEKITEPVKLGENEMRLSDLSKCKIIDSDGNNIGKINDVIFDNQSRPWFVVAGGFFEELFERIGIRPDIDPLVPQEFLKDISANRIDIKYSKMQLTTTAEKDWQEFKRELSVRGEPVEFHHQFLWLGGKEVTVR